MRGLSERRISKLESSGTYTKRGRECPECGWPPSKALYELLFLEEDEEDPVDAWCETCGRQTDFVIRFEDDEIA
jgi:hypothetical protein